MATTSLKFNELIDLAVGVPKVGDINVNVLHTILQLIVTQLGLQNQNVQFEGEDAKKVQVLAELTKPNPENLINYHVVERDGKGVTDNIESRIKSITTEAKTPVKMVEFRRLENKVRMIATQVEIITMLPNTDEMIEMMRSNPDTKPISEMVHNVSLTKRVSALEEGIDKLASILERIYKDQTKIRTAFSEQFPDVQIDTSDISMLEPITTGSPDETKETDEIKQNISLISEKEMSHIMKDHLETLGSKVDYLNEAVETLKHQVALFEEQKSPEERPPTPSEDVKHSLVENEFVRVDSTNEASFKRLHFLEKVCQSHEAKIRNIEQTTQIEIKNNQGRIKEVEGDLHKLMERLADVFGEDYLTTGVRQNSSTSVQRESTVATEILSVISSLQEEVTEMASGLQNLIADQERKNESFRKLKASIEKMEVTKLDKEVLEEFLAVKADTIAVNKKVSYEHFDVTCNEMNGLLNNTLQRLNEQEVQWGNALTEVHTAIKSKLDRNEISPIKDFLNHRLKVIQDKLKEILAEKLEAEGAATKKQLMKDLQCISCNKSVMQKLGKSCFKGVNEFPLSKSIKPYLTYELDQIRRQERKLPMSRNLNEFNKVLKEAVRGMKKNELNGEKIDHLCNRYCGGSHTQTTALQRVAKVGHYTEKWGIEVLPYAQQTENPTPAEKPTPNNKIETEVKNN